MAQCHCIFGWKTFWISSNFRFIKMSFNVIFFPISGYFSWVSFYLFCNIKPSNNQFCFPQYFLSWKRKKNFLLVENRFFWFLDQWKVCFLFQLKVKYPLYKVELWRHNYIKRVFPDSVFQNMVKFFVRNSHVFVEWTWAIQSEYDTLINYSAS